MTTNHKERYQKLWFLPYCSLPLFRCLFSSAALTVAPTGLVRFGSLKFRPPISTSKWWRVPFHSKALISPLFLALHPGASGSHCQSWATFSQPLPSLVRFQLHSYRHRAIRPSICSRSTRRISKGCGYWYTPFTYIDNPLHT